MIMLLGFTQAKAADDEPAPVNSAYVSLGDPMVLNLSGPKRLTFLQISADVLVSDSDAEETIKIHVPAIRHSLIMLLSEQKAGDIKSPARREEIRQQATSQVQALIADLSGSKEVSEILFSSILVQ
jgi:flagellar FliL protein